MSKSKISNYQKLSIHGFSKSDPYLYEQHNYQITLLDRLGDEVEFFEGEKEEEEETTQNTHTHTTTKNDENEKDLI